MKQFNNKNNLTMKYFNSLTKNEKQVLIISIILACALIFWRVNGFLSQGVSKDNGEDDATEQQAALPPKFSRITFFHAAKPICSLAIPENWEGKYRLQDNGDTAHFLYIQEAGNPELFYIKKYKKEGDINKEVERKIWGNKNSVYAASLSTQGVDELVNKDEFEKMTNDLDGVLKNFKCF